MLIRVANGVLTFDLLEQTAVSGPSTDRPVWGSETLGGSRAKCLTSTNRLDINSANNG